MKLKKLFKVLDKDTNISVLDLKGSIRSKYCTVEEFKGLYEKEVLNRKITYIEVNPACNADICIEIY